MALWIGLIVGTFVVGLLIWEFGPERRISFNEFRRREAARWVEPSAPTPGQWACVAAALTPAAAVEMAAVAAAADAFVEKRGYHPL